MESRPRDKMIRIGAINATFDVGRMIRLLLCFIKIQMELRFSPATMVEQTPRHESDVDLASSRHAVLYRVQTPQAAMLEISPV